MPGFLTWLRSTLRGEVSAAELNARRGAGTAAYSLFDEAASAPGDDRGTRLFRACAWNAFALQTIAETLIDVDAAEDPGTAGYVPQSTLRFARACVDRVPDWIRLARIAQSDPDAGIRGLPAQLPTWRTDEPTRRSELHALRTAYESLEARVDGDLRAVSAEPHLLAQLRRIRAEMESAAEYANAIGLRDAGPVDRGEARWRLLSALECAFLLGQLVAVPTLAAVVHAREAEPEIESSGGASWLRIEPGWPVRDCDGVTVGLVQRVRGDRETGELAGIDVSSGIAAAIVAVPARAVASVDAGEVLLSVTAAGLRP
jgi:hypothetical protein